MTLEELKECGDLIEQAGLKPEEIVKHIAAAGKTDRIYAACLGLAAKYIESNADKDGYREAAEYLEVNPVIYEPGIIELLTMATGGKISTIAEAVKAEIESIGKDDAGAPENIRLKSGIERAVASGAILGTGGWLENITGKDYKGILSPAGSERFIRGRLVKVIRDKEGKARGYDYSPEPLQDATFVLAIFTMFKKEYVRTGIISSEIRVYMPTFFEELGIDARQINKGADGKETKESRRNARLRIIQQLNDEISEYLCNLYDINGGEHWTDIFRIVWYSPDDDVAIISSQLCKALLENMTSAGIQTDKTDVIEDIITEGSFIAISEAEAEAPEAKPHKNSTDTCLKASAHACKDKAALEVVLAIDRLIVRRGTQPDVKYHAAPDWIKKKYRQQCKLSADERRELAEQGELLDATKVSRDMKLSDILEECPLLVSELKEIEEGRLKTQRLKRCLAAAYQYIQKQTNLYDKYVDFWIEDFSRPTKDKKISYRTIGSYSIEMSHAGLNPNYKRPEKLYISLDADRA